MEPIEFIKSKMDELVVKFPMIKLSYEFDSFDNTHTVLVEPYVIFNNYHDNELFDKHIESINKQFMELYPYDGLYFIDTYDMIPIKNVEYEVIGKDFEE